MPGDQQKLISAILSQDEDCFFKELNSFKPVELNFEFNLSTAVQPKLKLSFSYEETFSIATPLATAIIWGTYEMVEGLLKYNVPQLTNEGNFLALHVACRWGREKVVELLLANHANYFIAVESSEGYTALGYALMRDEAEKVKIIELLLKNNTPLSLGKKFNCIPNKSERDNITKLLSDTMSELNAENVPSASDHYDTLEILKLSYFLTKNNYQLALLMQANASGRLVDKNFIDGLKSYLCNLSTPNSLRVTEELTDNILSAIYIRILKKFDADLTFNLLSNGKYKDLDPLLSRENIGMVRCAIWLANDLVYSLIVNSINVKNLDEKIKILITAKQTLSYFLTFEDYLEIAILKTKIEDSLFTTIFDKAIHEKDFQTLYQQSPQLITKPIYCLQTANFLVDNFEDAKSRWDDKDELLRFILNLLKHSHVDQWQDAIRIFHQLMEKLKLETHSEKLQNIYHSYNLCQRFISRDYLKTLLQAFATSFNNPYFMLLSNHLSQPDVMNEALSLDTLRNFLEIENLAVIDSIIETFPTLSTFYIPPTKEIRHIVDKDYSEMENRIAFNIVLQKKISLKDTLGELASLNVLNPILFKQFCLGQNLDRVISEFFFGTAHLFKLFCENKKTEAIIIICELLDKKCEFLQDKLISQAYFKEFLLKPAYKLENNTIFYALLIHGGYDLAISEPEFFNFLNNHPLSYCLSEAAEFLIQNQIEKLQQASLIDKENIINHALAIFNRCPIKTRTLLNIYKRLVAQLVITNIQLAIEKKDYFKIIDLCRKYNKDHSGFFYFQDYNYTLVVHLLSNHEAVRKDAKISKKKIVNILWDLILNINQINSSERDELYVQSIKYFFKDGRGQFSFKDAIPYLSYARINDSVRRQICQLIDPSELYGYFFDIAKQEFNKTIIFKKKFQNLPPEVKNIIKKETAFICMHKIFSTKTQDNRYQYAFDILIKLFTDLIEEPISDKVKTQIKVLDNQKKDSRVSHLHTSGPLSSQKEDNPLIQAIRQLGELNSEELSRLFEKYNSFLRKRIRNQQCSLREAELCETILTLVDKRKFTDILPNQPFMNIHQLFMENEIDSAYKEGREIFAVLLRTLKREGCTKQILFQSLNLILPADLPLNFRLKRNVFIQAIKLLNKIPDDQQLHKYFSEYQSYLLTNENTLNFKENELINVLLREEEQVHVNSYSSYQHYPTKYYEGLAYAGYMHPI